MQKKCYEMKTQEGQDHAEERDDLENEEFGEELIGTNITGISHTHQGLLDTRLALMSFLEFAVWGSWLISLGNFLTRIGYGKEIAWFYATQGVMSLFMPSLMGYIADRWIPAQRLLGICHAICMLAMGGAGFYALNATRVEFGPLYTLFAISVAFFMPTVGLSNSIAFKTFRKRGMEVRQHFPIIRSLGSAGFISAMLFVNFTQYQTNARQLIVSGVLSGILAVYTLSLPDCRPGMKGAQEKENDERYAFKEIFSSPRMMTFLIFSLLMGVALQIANSYGNVFISSFGRLEEYADTWASNNANALISISQISETLCILLIPFALKRYGIKRVVFLSMIAWTLRFWLFAFGNTGSEVWVLVLSCIVYGIAFDFFNIAGGIYVDSLVPERHRAKAQGIFIGVTSGIGGTCGILIAQRIVNRLVFSQGSPELQHAGWVESWLIFGSYTLVIAILFLIFFKSGPISRKL